MMRYKITGVGKSGRRIEIWDADNEQIFDVTLKRSDSVVDGDEVPGLRHFNHRENIESLASFLNDWEVDEETVDRIIDDLDAWIAEMSLSEVGSIKRDIAKAKGIVAGRDKSIADAEKRLKAIRKQMDELMKEEKRLTAHIESLCDARSSMQGFVDELTEQLEALERR